MSHVPLVPIGQPRSSFLDDRSFADNAKKIAEREDGLRSRRDAVHQGWGAKYAERVRAKGKMTTRDRVARLVDPGTELFEVGTFVNDGETFGPEKLTSPAAGVVCAIARVE